MNKNLESSQTRGHFMVLGVATNVWDCWNLETIKTMCQSIVQPSGIEWGTHFALFGLYKLLSRPFDLTKNQEIHVHLFRLSSLKGNLLLGHISLNNYLTKSSQNANFSTEVQSLNQDFSEMTAS